MVTEVYGFSVLRCLGFGFGLVWFGLVWFDVRCF